MEFTCQFEHNYVDNALVTTSKVNSLITVPQFSKLNNNNNNNN